MFPRVIETERLRLESLERSTVDVLDLYEICSSDPDIDDVTRFVEWEPHRHPRETLEFVDEMVTARERGEVGTYVIRPREGEDGAGDLAGMAGFEVDWERQTMTLGCWLRSRFWGRGYSGERARACMRLAFDRLDLELVAALVGVENEASISAIEGYTGAHGGGRDGRLRNWIRLADGPVDCYRYSVSSAEWETSEPALEVRFED
ncbi:GNAT family N-acetyltransferase [Natronobiforma cellulositropha]|uniref:GNAT family N-acetyltransferase n=1 Tax=Natronobiforma cellulositropha TaxID=1679076 RepID=UPI003CCD322A